MVQSIRFDGLASGLNTQDIINKLMAVERMPLISMQSRQQTVQWRIDALKEIRSSVLALQNRATELTRSYTFNAMKTASSDEKVAAATAVNGSATASYLVNVTSLATADRYTSATLSFNDAVKAAMASTEQLNTASGIDVNPNAAFNSGSANLESAVMAGYFFINNVKITVAETDTINTVLNKITASQAGVEASYDLATDTITLVQKTGGDRYSIALSGDTSGFLAAAKLSAATVTPGVKEDLYRPLQDTPMGATITDGYFSINGTFFSVDTSKDSLNDLINRINSSKTAGVTAFYDAASKKISINSKTAGGDGAISFGTGTTDTSNFLTAVDITNTREAGADAVVTVNGAAVKPVDNKVTVNGTTITLIGSGQTTVTVQSDADKIVEAVKSFVEQYNNTLSLIKGRLNEKPLTEAETDEQRKVGILSGNAVLRNLSTSIPRVIFNYVSGMPSSMQQLSQIGISTGAIGSSYSAVSEGRLVLDETKLRSALKSDIGAVAALLGNGTAAVSNEDVGTGDGTATTFTLANFPVSYFPEPTITVGGVTYTRVSGTPSSNPADREYSLNFKTGEITFGAAPGAGQEIVAHYNYNLSTDSGAGIMVQLSSVLAGYTTTGGIFDASTGSRGSLTGQVKTIKDQMESLQRRLEIREQSYYRQFTALEKTLAILNNQSSWLNSQLSSLSSMWSSSSQ